MTTDNTVTHFAPRQSERISAHRKEKSFWHEISLFDLDSGRDVLNVRYYGSGATVYCCVWMHDLDRYLSHRIPGVYSARGAGKAGGYGYDKRSSALAVALKDAGFTLANEFAGTGETGERAALEAIARYLGFPRPMIHHAHA